MYTKYTPIRVNFDLVTNLTSSNKKLGHRIEVEYNYRCAWYSVICCNALRVRVKNVASHWCFVNLNDYICKLFYPIIDSV
jgi:hypothetical protein